jgi:hypothetical protein
MTPESLTQRVAQQLAYLTERQRRNPGRLIVSRITQGWAFLGVSREDHEKEVREILVEVERQLSLSHSR